METVLVIGGTGRTGLHIVRKLLERHGHVRVLVRDPKRARERLGNNVNVVEGNITQADSAQAATQGTKGVVIVVESAAADDGPNNLERVHYRGTQHVIEAVAPGTHIVLVTQIYITRPERYPEVRNIIHWRGMAEDALRRSGLPYTIVRPAWLTEGPSTGVRLEQGDTGEGQVSRAAVAEVCVRALLHSEARGKLLRFTAGVRAWRIGEPPLRHSALTMPERKYERRTYRIGNGCQSRHRPRDLPPAYRKGIRRDLGFARPHEERKGGSRTLPRRARGDPQTARR